MIKMQLFGFALRWLASSIGMYFCLTYLGSISPTEIPILETHAWMLYAAAGLIFSIINSVVKPLLKVFALPLAILTLGLSTLIINVAMVWLTIYLLPGVSMDFWGIAITSVVLSVINSVLNFLIK